MPEIVIVGKESSGKSMLAASLASAMPRSTNFRGSTVQCKVYQHDDLILIDTPGILLQSDSETTRIALAKLQEHECVALLVKATNLDDDLNDLLPLVKDKQGLIVVTFWDKVEAETAQVTLQRLGQTLEVPVVGVDTRHLSAEDRQKIQEAIQKQTLFKVDRLPYRIGWKIEPKAGILDWPWLGQLLAFLLLFAPAVVAVWAANTLAALIEPVVISVLSPLVQSVLAFPAFFLEILAGKYGFLTMFPLMFVWAVPTVMFYAFLLAAYKASGLAERLTVSLHPLVRPFGISGRDLLRVIMGFGCNVPAVVSTRACSSCTRPAAIGAIAFGAACSYQLGATLAVFASAGQSSLVVLYFILLIASTAIYTRLTSSKKARTNQNLLMIERRNFLELPSLQAIWREMRFTLSQFFGTALPIFLLITLIASVLNSIGLWDLISNAIAPFMRLFRLPPETALAVVLASVRKDGLLLLAQTENLTAFTPLQLLTAVYFGGVFMPCLVTLSTIAREISLPFALKLVARQTFFALIFTLLLAWGGSLLG